MHVEPRARMPAELSLPRQALHVLRHWRYGLPFWDASYYSAGAVRNARRIVAERSIDMLEVHTAHLAFMKRFMPDVPALLVNHNVEADLFPFWIQQNWPPLKRRIIALCAQRSRQNAEAVEMRNAFDFAEMTYISRADMARGPSDILKTHVPMAIPMTGTGMIAKQHPPFNAVWLGGFWWYPNLDAVTHFIDDILPLLMPKLANEGIVLNFVGANPPETLRRLAGPNLRVHGFVDDLDALLADMDLLFAPMRVGSGVRIKILEAMAAGLPVLTTAKGYEGLDAQDGQHLVEANNPSDFAEALVILARSPQRRSSLASNAMALLVRDHNIDDSVRTMDAIYQRVLRRSHAAGGTSGSGR